MSDREIRRLQRAVAEDPTDRRAVTLLARLYEAEGAAPTVFLLQDVNHEGPTFTRPFSTEKQAREVLAWIRKHEGRPGDVWAIDEVALDFFEPVAHPNRPSDQMLPGPALRRGFHKEEVPLNVCSRCGATTHARASGGHVDCYACRHVWSLDTAPVEEVILYANNQAAAGNFSAALVSLQAAANRFFGNQQATVLLANAIASIQSVQARAASEGRPDES